MEKIIEYLHCQYAPLAIIIYGSYADGSNNQGSDFDALLISKDHDTFHDTSFVDGIQLDVFVYPASCFAGDVDCNEFIQIWDGRIIHDTDRIGETLQQHIAGYVEQLPTKSDADICASIAWCQKMLERTKRSDTEGMFRWHWLLTESLEIFCDAHHRLYWGPKKTLRWMERQLPEAYALYQQALFRFDADSLSAWIAHLSQLTPAAKTQKNSV